MTTSSDLHPTPAMAALAEQIAATLTQLVADGATPARIGLQTRRPEGKLVVAPEGSAEVAFDYDHWQDDLARMPRRKLVLWSKALCSAIAPRLTHAGFAQQLVSFTWLRKPIACHHAPHWTEAARSAIGEIESVVFARSGAVVFGAQGLGVVGNEGNASAYSYSDIQHARLERGKLTLTTADGTLALEQSVVYEDDPDRCSDFDWRLLIERLPVLEVDRYDAEDLGIPDEALRSLREKADPIGAITHYIAHDEDREAVARVAAEALARDPQDLILIDAAVPSLLRLGRAADVLAMFEPVRARCLGVDSRYVGNLLAHVLVAYALLERADEGAALAREAWLDDATYVPRIFYFNAACLCSLAGDFETAMRAVEGAFARGNDLEDFEDESDLDALRDQPAYKALAERVAKAKPGSDSEALGPADGVLYIEDYRRRPNRRRLYDIAVLDPPGARELFESLITGPHVDEDTVQSAFYSLIALGDDTSLARAAALHDTADNRCNMLNFFLDGSDIANRLDNPEKFRRDVLEITGEELDS